MRGAFHQSGNEEQRRAQREHRRRHGIDFKSECRLRAALATLDDLREAVEGALPEGDASLARTRAALRSIVDGPKGEFR